MTAALPLKRPPDAPHPPILLPSPLRWRPVSVWPLVAAQALLGILTITTALLSIGDALQGFLTRIGGGGFSLMHIVLWIAVMPLGIALLGLARILPQAGLRTLSLARYVNLLGGLVTLLWAGWLFREAFYTHPFGYFLQFNYELGFKGLLCAIVAALWFWAAFRANRLRLEMEYNERPLRVLSDPAPHATTSETPQA